MRARGSRLFPDLKHDARTQLGGAPSRWFGRYLRRAGVKVDKRRNFHSLRHGFADALRAAGYLDHQVAILMGHTSSSSAVTRGYGTLQQGDLQLRVNMLARISFHETAHLQ